MPKVHGSKPIPTWEALQCIQATKAEYDARRTPDDPNPMPSNLAYVLKHSERYLTSLDAPTRPAPTETYTLDTPLNLVQRLSTAFGPSSLFESEYLQIMDMRPKNAIELETIIEEFEHRFGERQDELLAIITEVLGEIPKVTAEERQKEDEERKAEREKHLKDRKKKKGQSRSE